MNHIVFSFWRHIQTGNIYAVCLNDLGRVIAASHPVSEQVAEAGLPGAEDMSTDELESFRDRTRYVPCPVPVMSFWPRYQLAHLYYQTHDAGGPDWCSLGTAVGNPLRIAAWYGPMRVLRHPDGLEGTYDVELLAPLQSPEQWQQLKRSGATFLDVPDGAGYQ